MRPIAVVAVLTFVITGTALTFLAMAAGPVWAAVVFLIGAGVLLFFAALAVGNPWTLVLPFVPAISVAAWERATCDSDAFIVSCGYATALALAAAVFVGLPLVLIGTVLSSRWPNPSK